MKTKIQFKRVAFMLAAILVFAMAPDSAMAQSAGSGIDAASTNLIALAQQLYKILSVVAVIGSLYFIFKYGMDIKGGRSESWGKLLAVFLVAGIWFFAIPPIFQRMSTLAGVNSGNIAPSSTNSGF